MFAVSIFITYALQYYVPLSILWPHIEVRIMEATYSRRLFLQYVFRTVLVLLSCELLLLLATLTLRTSEISVAAVVDCCHTFDCSHR